MTLFDPGAPIPAAGPTSRGQRVTIRNADYLAAGIHPATRRPLLEPRDPAKTCGTCAHHSIRSHHSTRLRVWHKCRKHRLGTSHSTESDIRVSWPACVLWTEAPT